MKNALISLLFFRKIDIMKIPPFAIKVWAKSTEVFS